jgi:co-chaperonin GroES (HSP10)|tara:strand:+ start:2031 stop:2474 length:444 start_codon:yes stop_codon:yes gene_type:complete
MAEAAVKKKENKKDLLKSLYVEAKEKTLDPSLIDQPVLERLPTPTGWRMLILPYRPPKATKGGILLAENTLDETQIQTVAGYVLKLGPLAYRDKEKFPTGAWCEEKQWVVFARYAGSRFKIEGGEVRILNDDEILATIKNPEDILHN